MSQINSIFELLNQMAIDNDREELDFSMVFEPIHENGNRVSNLTNITFKFPDSIENIKFISTLKHREQFFMDLHNYPINYKIGNKVCLLFKEFNNIKCIELNPEKYYPGQLLYPNHTVRDYHQRIFNLRNVTGVINQKEVDLVKDYSKLPSISFISEDPFLFLNIYKYLENDNLKKFKTKFTFNYNWNDMLSTIGQSHSVNYRFFEKDSLKKKTALNWNVYDGYDGMGPEQFLFYIQDNEIISKANIISNINYNYTQNINLSSSNKKLVFLPAKDDKVMDLELFGSNQYLINSVDHGFIYYSQELNEYSYSGITIDNFSNLYNAYQSKVMEYSPGIPESGIKFLFRISLITVINTMYCVVHKDLDKVQEALIFELMQLSKLVLDRIIQKAPEFFENFTLYDLNNLNINVNNSLLRPNLARDEIDIFEEQIDKTLSLNIENLLDTGRFFNLIGNNYENNNILNLIFESSNSSHIDGSFIELMSYIQKNIEPDESKHLHLERFDLSNTFKNTSEHFIFREKVRNRLETYDLPTELWRMIPGTKKLDLVLVDDTPLKAKKIKYLTKNPGTKIIMFKDMVAEFYFRNIDLDLFTTEDIKIRWISEITFTPDELGKTEKVVNTSVNCHELKPADILLKNYHHDYNLSYLCQSINIDLEENQSLSIVSVLVDKDFYIAQDSTSRIGDTVFSNCNQTGFFINTFSNFIKKIVTEKFGKETRIVFSTKSIHNKLIKGGAIDFLSIKNTKYYDKVEEVEKILASRYSISENLKDIYGSLVYDIIRRSKIKTDYEGEFFNFNINNTYRDNYVTPLAIMLREANENGSIKNYPFINFFIDKAHPIISLENARPNSSVGSYHNINLAYGINISNGKANNSFIDIKNIEDELLNLLYSTKEFQSFEEKTQEDLVRYYGKLEDDDMNSRLAYFKMGNTQVEVINHLISPGRKSVSLREDYQVYLLQQFNNLLISRFKYQLNLSSDNIIKLFKLFREFDQAIIKNYKDYYYTNTGIKLEIPNTREVEEKT